MAASCSPCFVLLGHTHRARMVSSRNSSRLISKKYPLLRIQRAIRQRPPGELAVEAAVAAFFAVAADRAFRGAGNAGAVGSDQHIELFRFHWEKASGLGGWRLHRDLIGKKSVYG